MDQISLEDLKQKTPTELLAFAEEHEIENASAMLKQDMLFAILKKLADDDNIAFLFNCISYPICQNKYLVS